MNITQREREIKLSGVAREYPWVLEQYNKGALYVQSYSAGTSRVRDESTFQGLKTIIRLVSEIYEDNWDLDIGLTSGGIFNDGTTGDMVLIKGIVIYFPTINISNSQGNEHVIRDLFVKIELGVRTSNGVSKIYIPGTRGGRATFNFAEWSSDYAHSHLPGIQGSSDGLLPFYSAFCTGSGHINDFLAEINGGEDTEENFTKYLVQIMGLVNYESLEGGPHRNMTNIYPRNTNGVRYQFNENHAKTLYERTLSYHRQGSITPDLEFAFENNKYVLRDDDRFDRFLKATQTSWSNAENIAYLAMIDETGTAWRYGAEPNNQVPNIPSVDPYIFRGREIPLTVSELPGNAGVTIEYKIHPKVKQHISKLINNDIYKKTIRKSTINRYSN